MVMDMATDTGTDMATDTGTDMATAIIPMMKNPERKPLSRKFSGKLKKR